MCSPPLPALYQTLAPGASERDPPFGISAFAGLSPLGAVTTGAGATGGTKFAGGRLDGIDAGVGVAGKTAQPNVKRSPTLNARAVGQGVVVGHGKI
jgi:hypothetical protein